MGGGSEVAGNRVEAGGCIEADCGTATANSGVKVGVDTRTGGETEAKGGGTESRGGTEAAKFRPSDEL